MHVPERDHQRPALPGLPYPQVAPAVHETCLVLFLVIDDELIRVNDHGGPVVIGIDAEIQNRQAGIDGNEQPILQCYFGVTHRLEHLLAQKKRHQPAQATLLFGVQAVTGRQASERLREVRFGDKAVAQITLAPPTLKPGRHVSES